MAFTCRNVGRRGASPWAAARSAPSRTTGRAGPRAVDTAQRVSRIFNPSTRFTEPHAGVAPWQAAWLRFGNGGPDGSGDNGRHDGDDSHSPLDSGGHGGSGGIGTRFAGQSWKTALLCLSTLLLLISCGDDDEAPGPSVKVHPSDSQPDGFSFEDTAGVDATDASEDDAPTADDATIDTAPDAGETNPDISPETTDSGPESDAPRAQETTDVDDTADTPDTIGPPVVPNGIPFGTPVDNPIFAEATDANLAGCLYIDSAIISPLGLPLLFQPALFDAPGITPMAFQFAAYPVTNSAQPVAPWFAGPVLVFQYEPGTKEDFDEATWHANVNGQALVAIAHHDWPLGSSSDQPGTTYPLVIEIADPLAGVAYYWPADFPTAIMECPEVPL
ncbi:MAG: hypothetical protein HY696_04835 [Deltaproteobacteria bacterium]|nr:hypothetical protein [Deltaproteobacteria bacterium]